MTDFSYPEWVNFEEKVTKKHKTGKKVEIPRFVEVENSGVPGVLGDTLTGRRVYPTNQSIDSIPRKRGTSLEFVTPAEAFKAT